MANELHVIETLGIIVNGVEWLIRRLSRYVFKDHKFLSI